MTALYDIQDQVNRFRNAEKLFQDGEGLTTIPLCQDGFGLAPEGFDGDDRWDLILMGLTHGNELAGVAVLNQILGLVQQNPQLIPCRVGFVLGNVPAALLDQRFVERDLNRSFDRKEKATAEERRADELEGVLVKTKWLLDLHQTRRGSDRPFFIFPFRRTGYEFARGISPKTTIVTHWGGGFSTAGRCTDEFVNTQGGTGITLEMGQNGFDPYQIAYGTVTCLSAIAWAGAVPTKRPIPSGEGCAGPIFQLEGSVPYPAEGDVVLNETLDNFYPFCKGDELGRVDGATIQAPCDGRVLFPAFPTRERSMGISKRPQDLCRILHEVQPEDLPES